MQWRHKKSIILKNKFDILYCKYNRLMFIEAKLILRDDFLSEDAVHETFARIINGQYDIIEDGREKGYLVKACRNVCFDMLNKMSKLSADVELKDEALDYTAIIQDMPEDIVLCGELKDAIIRIAGSLDDKYRDTMIFKVVFNRTVKEIADLCGISEGNVRTRLTRAKAMIVKELEKEGLLYAKTKSDK